MDISYKRNAAGNYILLEDTGFDGNGTTLKMLEINRPSSFLDLTVRKLNGHICLWYDMTSMQPLTQAYERTLLDGRDIRMITDGLTDVMEDVKRYLLCVEEVCFDPAYIFVGSRKTRFLYIPGEADGGSMKALSEFILKKLNHKDPDAVSLGYALYGQVQRGYFDASSLAAESPGESSRIDHETADDIQDDLLMKDIFDDIADDEKLSGRRKEKQKKKPEKKTEKALKKNSSKSREKDPSKSRRQLSLLILAAAAVSILFGGIVWFADLDLTQTGGLFFGFIALIWLTVSVVSRHRNKKKNVWAELVDDHYEEEEEAFLAALMQDVYQDQEAGYDDAEIFTDHRSHHALASGSAVRADKEIKELEETDSGETRFLGQVDRKKVLYLVSQDVRRSRDLEITADKALIGKSREQVDACIPLDVISRIHACIEQSEDGCTVTDRNSTNGTFLNGEPVIPLTPVPFRENDILSFATVAFKVTFRYYL